MRIFEKAVTAYAIAREVAENKGETFPYENEEQWLESLKGNDGQNGTDGKTPQFASVNVTTLEPGQNATASITGDIQSLTLDFGIPKGEKGDDGNNAGSDWSDIQNKPEVFSPSSHQHSASEVTGLSAVATSGSYNDLLNKPTIPSSLPANGGNSDTVDGYHIVVSTVAPTVNNQNIITFVV